MAETLRFLWKGSLMALATALLCGFAAFVVSFRQEPTYQARSTVYATATPSTDRWLGTGTYSPARLDASAYGFAVVSDNVLALALDRLGVTEITRSAVNALYSKIGITLDETSTTSFVHITVRDRSPASATEAANALAQALVAWDAERTRATLRQVATTLETQLASLEQASVVLADSNDPIAVQEAATNMELIVERRNSLRLLNSLASTGSGSLAVFQSASQPTEAVAPRPAMNAALGFVLGIVVGYGIVLAYQALRDEKNVTSTLLVRE